MLTHKELKAKALNRADVKAEYDSLDEEFAILDEFLKARAAAGVFSNRGCKAYRHYTVSHCTP